VPGGVSPAAAEIDLRAGGRYRFANRHQDGSVLWISGVFEVVDRPRRITCTWAHEPSGDTTEHARVAVRFDYRGQGREVIVVHQGFRSAHSQETRGAGWTNASTGQPP
jgi:uncharacterized protein YndB with AHSA1/START domain